MITGSNNGFGKLQLEPSSGGFYNHVPDVTYSHHIIIFLGYGYAKCMIPIIVELPDTITTRELVDSVVISNHKCIIILKAEMISDYKC